MSKINKHGLSRYIPGPISRKIRQECGFGCAICGNLFGEYAHLDPPFEEAKIHDPKKMAYLCGTCHHKVDKNIWSMNKALKARENPITFKNGVAKDIFDIEAPFTLLFGSNQFTDFRCIVENGKDQWFTIEPPESDNEPPLINATFFGPNGDKELEIIKNEWLCSNRVYDVEIEGPKIIIRYGPRKILLSLITSPPNKLIIERLDMMLGGTGIKIKDGDAKIFYSNAEISVKSSRIAKGEAIFTLP